VYGPTPPLPLPPQAEPTREVRQVTPQEAKRYHREQTGTAGDAAEVLRDFEDLATEVARSMKAKDDLSRELEAATARLAQEASQPVIDEPAARTRTRGRRQR
jgi:hypothetical protein